MRLTNKKKLSKQVHNSPFQVDFFWINREQRSFEWFFQLLTQLEVEQVTMTSAIFDLFKQVWSRTVFEFYSAVEVSF